MQKINEAKKAAFKKKAVTVAQVPMISPSPIDENSTHNLISALVQEELDKDNARMASNTAH